MLPPPPSPCCRRWRLEHTALLGCNCRLSSYSQEFNLIHGVAPSAPWPRPLLTSRTPCCASILDHRMLLCFQPSSTYAICRFCPRRRNKRAPSERNEHAHISLAAPPVLTPPLPAPPQKTLEPPPLAPPQRSVCCRCRHRHSGGAVHAQAVQAGVAWVAPVGGHNQSHMVDGPASRQGRAVHCKRLHSVGAVHIVLPLPQQHAACCARCTAAGIRGRARDGIDPGRLPSLRSGWGGRPANEAQQGEAARRGAHVIGDRGGDVLVGEGCTDGDSVQGQACDSSAEKRQR